MTVATLVLGLTCLIVLLVTGLVVDARDQDDIDTLGVVLTFLIMPMLLALTILGIIQVAS